MQESSVNQTVTSSSMSHYTSSKDTQPSKYKIQSTNQSFITAYHVKIAVNDLVLEESMSDIKKETI